MLCNSKTIMKKCEHGYTQLVEGAFQQILSYLFQKKEMA